MSKDEIRVEVVEADVVEETGIQKKKGFLGKKLDQLKENKDKILVGAVSFVSGVITGTAVSTLFGKSDNYYYEEDDVLVDPDEYYLEPDPFEPVAEIKVEDSKED